MKISFAANALRSFVLGALMASGTGILPLAVHAGPARIALVIGNEHYDRVESLDNAVRDAKDMASLLRGFGFDVFDGYDLTRPDFENLVRTTLLNTPENSEVVFFYAGHGIQIGRRNYLLPTDVSFDSIYDLPTETITLDRLSDLLTARGSSHVLIIDACRENPFPRRQMAANLDASLFETATGFEIMRTPINSLIAFSTSPGEIAYDGEGSGNSPYTAALLTSTESLPEENILTILSDVRRRVYESTKGRQVPWESSTLLQPFYLSHGIKVASTTSDHASGAPIDETSAEADLRGTAETVEEKDGDGEIYPASIAINTELDREVPLSQLIERDYGISLIHPAVIAEPGAGKIDISDDEVFYRPVLEEKRAGEEGVDTLTLRDHLKLDTGEAESRHTLEITLEMTVDRCDYEAGDALDIQGVGYFRLPNEISVDRAIEACTDAMEKHPDSARFRYQLGRAEQAARDLPSAYENFKIAADAGHVRALNSLAYLMFTDRIDRSTSPIPSDLATANSLLDKAIASGDPFAMHTKGRRLLREGESQEERQAGFELLERAVELGHTYSMNELGAYFLDKDSDHFQPERGLVYLNASAARNDIYGFNNLGLAALRGTDGTPPDYALAFEWFKRAADGGHPFAPANIGRMIMRGQLSDKDLVSAVAWYDLGLSRGDGWGGANAADIILSRKVPDLGPADAAVRAAKAYHLSSEAAREAAEETLGKIDANSIDKATQIILNEMGAGLSVDGKIGPGSLSALESLARSRNLISNEQTLPKTGRDRLLLAAKIYWVDHPIRVDVF